MGRDWDGIIEPSDGQVFLGCRPLDPSMDATSGRQRPDGTWTFRRRARKVKKCHCGSGKAGFVQPGGLMVCEACSRGGQDFKLPSIILPPRPEPPAPQKSPEGVKPLTRRERRKRKYSPAS